MQKPRRLYLTQHRRQRLVLWALAMLAWVASLFAGRAPSSRHLRQRGYLSIDAIAMFVKELILARAAEFARVKPQARPRYFKRGRDLRRRHLRRSILGSRLRRAFVHRDPAKRVAILIDALTHLDAWAARFAKRLSHKLTRLYAIPPTPMADVTLFGSPSPPAAYADSS